MKFSGWFCVSCGAPLKIVDSLYRIPCFCGSRFFTTGGAVNMEVPEKKALKELCMEIVAPYWNTDKNMTVEVCYKQLPCPIHSSSPKERIDHPEHYGGKDNPYEAIKVIEAWSLGFCLGNAVKYICRFGKKDDRRAPVEDLKKARWYLDREIQRIEADENNQANRKSD